jgi:putative ABC transport system permease protein
VIGLIELRRRKLQFALIGLVVTLISYLVLMINGLGVGLNELAGSALKDFDADAIAYSESAGLSVIRSELDQALVDAASSRPGVKEAAAIGYLAANYRDDDGEIASAAMLGFDPGTIGEPPVTDGRALSPEDENAILADKSFLEQSGYEVGDTISVEVRLQQRDFRIVGEIDEGAFFFQPAVYILRTTWQDVKYGDVESPPVASIVLLKGDGLTGQGDGFEAVSKSEAFANIEGVAGQQSTVQALQAFGYIIGAMVIGVFFYVLTLQKIPNIGVLKAVGASNRFVFTQILVQVVVVAAAGLAISLPLAILTERALAQLPETVPIAFTNRTLVITAAVLMLTSLVGAAFSARQVVKVDPIIALGQQQ